LTPSIAKLAPESPFFLRQHPGETPLKTATTSAKFQFQAWCNSFRSIIEKDNPRRLVIRFFVGDAVSFCLGLQGLSDPVNAANCYSRPGTTRMLRLDNRDEAPKTFDVIDTGYLVDRIGLLNILPHVALLLRNSASVLYTSTWVTNVATERYILREMLCADVGIMCMLLGIVPAAYLNGHTSYAYHAYHDARPHTAIPLNNRIAWVMTKAGDHKLEFSRVSPTCDVKSIVQFVFVLYNEMFDFEWSNPRKLTGNHAYTRYTFAALLRYFKRRIFGIDGNEFAGSFLRVLIAASRGNVMDSETHLAQIISELVVQLALCDVCDVSASIHSPDDFGNGPAPISVLGQHNLPDPCAVVITVPRSRLRRIYDKLNTDAANTRIAFQLYLTKEKCVKDCEGHYTTISCVQAVFGKFVCSANGKSGTIEEDQSKWAGTSDLHVFGYFSSLIIGQWEHTGEPHPIELGVALTPTSETIKLFEAELGDGLSVFSTSSTHADAVHFFDRLPGLKQPHPKETTFGTRDDVAQTTDSFIVDFPVLDLEKPSFTTHVKTVGPALKCLQKKEKLSIVQFSPCTLNITFGRFEVQGNYTSP
jgi:hypothetical protein